MIIFFRLFFYLYIFSKFTNCGIVWRYSESVTDAEQIYTEDDIIDITVRGIECGELWSVNKEGEIYDDTTLISNPGNLNEYERINVISASNFDPFGLWGLTNVEGEAFRYNGGGDWDEMTGGDGMTYISVYRNDRLFGVKAAAGHDYELYSYFDTGGTDWFFQMDSGVYITGIRRVSTYDIPGGGTFDSFVIDMDGFVHTYYNHGSGATVGPAIVDSNCEEISTVAADRFFCLQKDQGLYNGDKILEYDDGTWTTIVEPTLPGGRFKEIAAGFYGNGDYCVYTIMECKNCSVEPLIVRIGEENTDPTGKRNIDGFSGEIVASNDDNPITGILIKPNPSYYKLPNDLEYKCTLEDSGESDWMDPNQLCGSLGGSSWIEGIRIRVDNYDVTYRVNIIGSGWSSYCSSGEYCGTNDGQLSAIEILINDPDCSSPEEEYWGSECDVTTCFDHLRNDSSACSYWGDCLYEYCDCSDRSDRYIEFYVHAQTYGDTEYFSEGEIALPGNEEKRIEGIQFRMSDEYLAIGGDLEYYCNVESDGYTAWMTTGNFCGTTGASKRLKGFGLRFKMDVEPMDKHLSVFYRVKLSVSGWIECKNGEYCGTEGGETIYQIEVSTTQDFVGDQCEFYRCDGIRNNDSSVCNSRGSCTHSETCVCENSFGEFCDSYYCHGLVDGDTEKKDICFGHGDCYVYDHCTCDHGYFGEQCNVTTCYGEWNNISTPAYCYNRGDCVNHDSCECEDNYYGLECNITTCGDLFSNTSSVCNNKGVCGLEFNKCHCIDGYYGEECKETICHGIWSNDTDYVCSNHGKCLLEDHCTCDDNYYGTHCNISTCDGKFSNISTTCTIYGECMAYEKCACDSDYYGKYCLTTTCWDDFSNSTEFCSGIEYAADYCWPKDKCHCNPGYYGSKCEVTVCNDVFSNSSEICLGHGEEDNECWPNEECNCIDGWRGGDCEEPRCNWIWKTNSSFACSMDKGTCTSKDHCTCLDDYYGSDCEITTCFEIYSNESSNVCNGYGECWPYEECSCEEEEGYFGLECFEFIDPLEELILTPNSSNIFLPIQVPLDISIIYNRRLIVDKDDFYCGERIANFQDYGKDVLHWDFKCWWIVNETILEGKTLGIMFQMRDIDNPLYAGVPDGDTIDYPFIFKLLTSDQNYTYFYGRSGAPIIPPPAPEDDDEDDDGIDGGAVGGIVAGATVAGLTVGLLVAVIIGAICAACLLLCVSCIIIIIVVIIAVIILLLVGVGGCGILSVFGIMALVGGGGAVATGTGGVIAVKKGADALLEEEQDVVTEHYKEKMKKKKEGKNWNEGEDELDLMDEDKDKSSESDDDDTPLGYERAEVLEGDGLDLGKKEEDSDQDEENVIVNGNVDIDLGVNINEEDEDDEDSNNGNMGINLGVKVNNGDDEEEEDVDNLILKKKLFEKQKEIELEEVKVEDLIKRKETIVEKKKEEIEEGLSLSLNTRFGKRKKKAAKKELKKIDKSFEAEVNKILEEDEMKEAGTLDLKSFEKKKKEKKKKKKGKKKKKEDGKSLDLKSFSNRKKLQKKEVSSSDDDSSESGSESSSSGDEESDSD